MAKMLRCPYCGREFPDTPVDHLGAICPECGWRPDRTNEEEASAWSQSGETIVASGGRCAKCKQDLPPAEDTRCWDMRHYCLPCIEDAGLSDFDPVTDELTEVVHFSILGLLIRAFWSGVLMTTVVSLMITSLLAVLGTAFLLAAAIAGNIAQGFGIELIWNAAYGLGMFFGFSWLFVAVVCFPLMFVYTIAGYRRTLVVKDGKLTISTPFAENTVSLSECTWAPRSILMDSYGAYLPGYRPGVVIGKESYWCACGFVDKTKSLWTGFLTLSGIERQELTLSNPRRLLLGLLYGYILGGCVGAVTGLIAFLVTGDSEWLGPWIFLGMLEGPILSAWYVTLKTSSGDRRERLGKGYNFGIAFLGFVALGMKIGSFLGMQGMVICGFVNGVLASIAALVVIRPLLRRDTGDGQTSPEQR